MRWLVLTLLVGCMGSDDDGRGGTIDEGPNLLRNSDFEQVDGSGWLVDWDNIDGNPDGQIVVVQMAHSGSRALQWQMDVAGDGREYWVTQQGVTPQQVQPGRSYALVGWYHVDQPDVALNYIVRGQPGDTPDLSTVSDAAVFPKVVGTWSAFRFELTIPVDAAAQTYEVSLHSIKFNMAATKLTLDHVRLFELPPEG
jgi:hypothetical protein